MPLAAAQKPTKASERVAGGSSGSSITPAATGAAKTSTFFAHCLGRSERTTPAASDGGATVVGHVSGRDTMRHTRAGEVPHDGEDDAEDRRAPRRSRGPSGGRRRSAAATASGVVENGCGVHALGHAGVDEPGAHDHHPAAGADEVRRRGPARRRRGRPWRSRRRSSTARARTPATDDSTSDGAVALLADAPGDGERRRDRADVVDVDGRAGRATGSASKVGLVAEHPEGDEHEVDVAERRRRRRRSPAVVAAWSSGVERDDARRSSAPARASRSAAAGRRASRSRTASTTVRQRSATEARDGGEGDLGACRRARAPTGRRRRRHACALSRGSGAPSRTGAASEPRGGSARSGGPGRARRAGFAVTAAPVRSIRARVPVVSDFEPAGDQPEAIDALAEGIEARRAVPDAAGHHRLGQERHHRLDHRAGAAAHAGARAQQVAGRPAGQRVPGVLPREPGRVLRLATTTTTSPRRTCRPPTPTSRRTRR